MADVPDLGSLGVSGLKRFGGYVLDEWLPELQGVRGRQVIREMKDNDPTVGAILFALTMLIKQVSWSIEPHETGLDDQGNVIDERVQFLEECRHDMSVTWGDVIGEICTFLPWGWALLEQNFKIRDGVNSRFDDRKIGWRSWALRGQETLLHWEFDPASNEVEAMVQLGPPDYQEHVIPLSKALLFRTTTERGNPEGRSILRNAYRPWFFKKHIEQIEGIGIERDLAGLPVIHVPAEYLASDAPNNIKAAFENFKAIVRGIRRDENEGVIMPRAFDVEGNEIFKLELLSSGGTRQFDTDAIITRYDQRILTTVMADFIMMGQQAIGSYSLANVKSQFFSSAMGSWLDSVSDVINRDAIPLLLQLNGYDTADAPQLVHGDIERADLSIIGVFIQQLAAAGMPIDKSPGSELMKYLMEQAQMPPPPTKEAYQAWEDQQREQQAQQAANDFVVRQPLGPLPNPGDGTANNVARQQSSPPLINTRNVVGAKNVPPIARASEDLARWKRLAAVDPGVIIQSDAIPPAVAQAVISGLAFAETPHEVDAVFALAQSDIEGMEEVSE